VFWLATPLSNMLQASTLLSKLYRRIYPQSRPHLRTLTTSTPTLARRLPPSSPTAILEKEIAKQEHILSGKADAERAFERHFFTSLVGEVADEYRPDIHVDAREKIEKSHERAMAERQSLLRDQSQFILSLRDKKSQDIPRLTREFCEKNFHRDVDAFMEGARETFSPLRDLLSKAKEFMNGEYDDAVKVFFESTSAVPQPSAFLASVAYMYPEVEEEVTSLGFDEVPLKDTVIAPRFMEAVDSFKEFKEDLLREAELETLFGPDVDRVFVRKLHKEAIRVFSEQNYGEYPSLTEEKGIKRMLEQSSKGVPFKDKLKWILPADLGVNMDNLPETLDWTRLADHGPSWILAHPYLTYEPISYLTFALPSNVDLDDFEFTDLPYFQFLIIWNQPAPWGEDLAKLVRFLRHEGRLVNTQVTDKLREDTNSIFYIQPELKKYFEEIDSKLSQLKSYDTARVELFNKYMKTTSEMAQERPDFAAQNRVSAWAQTILFGSDFSYVPPQLASLSWATKNMEIHEHVRTLDSSFLLARSIFSSQERNYVAYDRKVILDNHFFDQVDLWNLEMTGVPWEEWFARSCEVDGIDPDQLQAFAEELLVSDHFDLHRIMAENRAEAS